MSTCRWPKQADRSRVAEVFRWFILIIYPEKLDQREICRKPSYWVHMPPFPMNLALNQSSDSVSGAIPLGPVGIDYKVQWKTTSKRKTSNQFLFAFSRIFPLDVVFWLPQIHRLQRWGASACQLGLGWGATGTTFELCAWSNRWWVKTWMESGSECPNNCLKRTHTVWSTSLGPRHLLRWLRSIIICFPRILNFTHTTHTIPYPNLNRIHCSEET